MGLLIGTIIMKCLQRVEYGLTELGKEMMPIIDALADFGNYYKSVID